jgi:hypothetical protein
MREAVMKSFQIALFAALTLAAAPVAAFTIQGGEGAADNSARYADPDERPQPYNYQDSRQSRVTRFGDSGITFGFSGGPSEPRNVRPDSYEATHPSTSLPWDTRSRMWREGR